MFWQVFTFLDLRCREKSELIILVKILFGLNFQTFRIFDPLHRGSFFGYYRYTRDSQFLHIL